jgi:transcriptional regulator with XRE-family HTH domain
MDEILRNLRKKNGYTQEKLSLELKVSRQTISNWERGISLPDIENISLLSKFYNVPIGYLLGNQDLGNDYKKSTSFLYLLTIASFLTPLAAFILVYLVDDYKNELSVSQFKLFKYLGYFLSILNLIIIFFILLLNIM